MKAADRVWRVQPSKASTFNLKVISARTKEKLRRQPIREWNYVCEGRAVVSTNAEFFLSGRSIIYCFVSTHSGSTAKKKRDALNTRRRIKIYYKPELQNIVVVTLMLRDIQSGDGRKPSKLPQIHSHLAIAASSDFNPLCLKSITLSLSASCARASIRDGSRGPDYKMPGYRWEVRILNLLI